MLRKSLLLKIFDSANMQRWNDKIRPVELRELDKQAHKMIIAYFLGRFEEERGPVDWIGIIEGGFFEFLQRLVLTDLKPQIFYLIRKDRARYVQLNEWIYRQLEPLITPLGPLFCARFREYFEREDEGLTRRILKAAHFYATKWEFNIIERADPEGYEIAEIKRALSEEQEKYYDLKGIQQLALYPNYRNFIDLCGNLRFQLRWSHIHRVPKTSVLGHMLIVAILSYLFSLETGACRQRCVNNYLNGLFHDLPEVLTRDIISPVKRSIGGLKELIKDYEKELMDREVYRLIPGSWHADIRMFTESEFRSGVTVDGDFREVTSDEISAQFNEDRYDPRDGGIVEAADNLAAFIEAYMALKNGITSPDLEEAKMAITARYKDAVVAGISLGALYADFT